MFTPSQVSETLGIPASTIRRWANRFAPYLSEQPGKKRMYTISDLDMFRQIRTFSSQGLSLDQIADSLKVREPDQVKAVELLALDDFAQALEGLFADNAKLQEQINDQQKQISQLVAWVSLPWYKRVGKPAPVQ
jgi:DNA-binding transcriptional MerR regulator